MRQSPHTFSRERLHIGDTCPRGARILIRNPRIQVQIRRGGMAEWSMAVVLKTTAPETVPGVRIPLPPPTSGITN
jgi:hypothetical protein